MVEESENWREGEGGNPWTEVVLRDERFVLQLDIREAATLLQMYGSNLASGSDVEDTRKKIVEIANKLKGKWEHLEK